MSYEPRENARYTRRRRRPAVLGTAVFASIIVLALGGLTLVGLDTVNTESNRLTRVAQPEIAQAPEVTHKEDSENSEEQASGGREENKDENKGEEQSSSKDEGSQKQNEKKDDEKKSEEKSEKEDSAPPDPQSTAMWMSVPRLGMQSDTVFNSSSHEQMGVGAIKLPPTGFPWEESANTYISAHRIGYPGTQSDNQFYALPAMQENDVIYVGDANGTSYEYRVTKKFAVKPWENWVTEPKAGEDLLTLQTCVDSLDPNTWWDISPKLMRSGPDSARLIVRAEKVDTYYPSEY